MCFRLHTHTPGQMKNKLRVQIVIIKSIVMNRLNIVCWWFLFRDKILVRIEKHIGHVLIWQIHHIERHCLLLAADNIHRIPVIRIEIYSLFKFESVCGKCLHQTKNVLVNEWVVG